MTGRPNRPQDPWALPPADLIEQMEVNPVEGLSRSEAARRAEIFGANLLRQTMRVSAWKILVRQLKSIIVGLLAVGAGLSFALGETLEGFAILAVIVINTAIAFATELKAVRSTEALRRLGTNRTTVRRGGVRQRVAAQDLVPGDVAMFEGGDIVTADVRLIVASRTQVDESTLTGESVPVSKSVDTISARTDLADRSNMLFKGTALTRGTAEGIVTATGSTTELGRITTLVQDADDVETPLERRTREFGRVLAWLCVAFVAIIAVAGVLSGKDVGTVTRTAIALAIATVPEGLPIVATLALARGVLRMARRNAVVEKLSAVEALGSTSVIFTDKTGTLTENRMRVSRVATAESIVDPRQGGPSVDDEGFTDLISAAALCTEVTVDTEYISDPMEAALVELGRENGLPLAELLERAPRIGEEAFDPALKLMATFHRKNDVVVAMVKGAPEAVFAACTTVRVANSTEPFDRHMLDRWLDTNERLASEGLRVLAVATKVVGEGRPSPYRDLTLLGLVGLVDPPRATVRTAIEQCRDAGIDVVMVTGDQQLTAESIGKSVGVIGHGSDKTSALGKDLVRLRQVPTALRSYRIFARTDPAQKLQLLQDFQSQGEIVAMVGDGVNDAPALKRSDVGVAMGQRGTQVAREAADIVLRDDDFGTIVAAIEEGRVIFRNLRTFVVYLLSCNMSEILTVGVASIFNAPLPILPLQILFLNLVTDVFPALALGVSRGDDSVMARPPRDPRERFLLREHWTRIVGYSFLITLAVLTGLAIALIVFKLEAAAAVTVSFLVLAFAQLAHVFNMADAASGAVVNEITRNPWVWGAIVLCTGLLIAGVYAPGLSMVLGTRHLEPRAWALVAALSLVPLVVGRLVHFARRPGSRCGLGALRHYAGSCCV